MTIPNLKNYVANAYNALQGNFLSNPVFEVTTDADNTVMWNGVETKVPDQISASSGTEFTQVDSTLVLRNEADYDRTFSLSLGAEFSGATFTGSTNSSLLYHGNLFESQDKTYALNFAQQRVLSFERLTPKIALEDDFATALGSLPADTATSASKQKYIEFFDLYGTHYITNGAMGGTLVMETDVLNTLWTEQNSLEVRAAIEAGFEGVVKSGNVSSEAAYGASQYLEAYKSDIVIKTNVMGGLYSQGESINAWQESLYNSPILLLDIPHGQSLTVLAPISHLVGCVSGLSSDIASNIDSMMQAYMTQDESIDGLLASPENIPFGVVKERKLGGFVLASIQSESNGDRGYLHASEGTDQSSLPNRATASQHHYGAVRIPDSSLMMPVRGEKAGTEKAGTSFVANEKLTSGQPSTSAKYVGFAIQDDPLDAYENVELNTTHTSTGGFVVAYVDWNKDDGSRGYIHGLLDGAIVAGASQHRYWDQNIIVPTNSFCMPVPAQSTFQVKFEITSGNPIAGAFFVPLAGNLSLSKPENRQEGIGHPAKTDGFLVAYLHQTADGNCGSVKLYSHSNATDLTLGELASTSIHYWTGGQPGPYVPCNTATIPVSKGNYYKAKLVSNSHCSEPTVSVSWFPLKEIKTT